MIDFPIQKKKQNYFKEYLAKQKQTKQNEEPFETS